MYASPESAISTSGISKFNQCLKQVNAFECMRRYSQFGQTSDQNLHNLETFLYHKIYVGICVINLLLIVA